MLENILIVDDCCETRFLLKEILIKIKIAKNIVEAENGIIAVMKSKNQKFDLIITDNQMPKHSGIDFAIDLVRINAYEPSQLMIVSG